MNASFNNGIDCYAVLTTTRTTHGPVTPPRVDRQPLDLTMNPCVPIMNPCALTRALPLRWALSAPLCLALFSVTAAAQSASSEAKAKDAVVVSDAPPEKDVVQLSPFQVVENNRGYYSANTMSGTRFNTKLDDLASSITVMTKKQMTDFGMTNINDVFLYMAGTEGTGTYTDFSVDRNGSLSDNVQINPTGANRVRGIASANVSLGNIETMNRVPLDPIFIEALELSRGPNANVFGLGNPSGTLNLVPVTANLTRDKAASTFRVSRFGGYRTSLDINRVLLPGKLAIRGSAVFQHEGFERKPSGVDSELYNGFIKYQPFKNTTITGALNYYHAYGNRPNSLPPRDNLRYWIASGKPTWDPVTQQIHINGVTVATVTAATYNGPDYFSATYLGNDHNQMFIDQNGLSYWSTPRGTTSTTSPTGATLQAARYLQPTAAAGAVFSGTAPRPFAQPLFNTTPTISDPSIYDYSEINLSAPNRFWDRTLTSNFNVDQIIINTPTQTLAAQFSFMREDSQRFARNLVGIANDNGQSGQLTVDINERRLDGTPNPFFLRPYLSVDKPRTVSQPAKWDTTRAQLAYRLDLTQDKNDILNKLGWFQLTGYGEYKYRVNRQYSYRDAIAGGATWLPAGTYAGHQAAPAGTPAVVNLTQGLYRYYVGDNSGNNVDYAPGDFKYGNYPFVWGNAATGVFRTDNLTLAPVAADKSGGSFNTKVVLKTIGGVLQNHLFGDRLVTTLGARYDKTYTKFGNPGNPANAFVNADGTSFNYDLINGWAANYFENGGRTTNIQFVARPFAETAFSNGLGKSTFLGSLVNGFALTYNRSNSFLPLNPAQDLNQRLLPNPTGTDKSYGFALNLLDGKIVVRATHFDNYQKNSQNGDASTMAQRVSRTDVAISGATPANPPINLQPNAVRWVTAQNPTWTADQINAEVAKEMGLTQGQLDFLFLPTPPIGTTNDIRSRGNEVEIFVNPSNFWTVSASVTDTKSTNLNVSKSLSDWIDQRMKIWTTIKDPTINPAVEPAQLWWTHRYAATGQTPQENFQAFVGAPYAVIKALEGKNNPQVRRYAFRASSSFQLAGLTDQRVLKKMSIGGALRWEDKGAIGYYGVQTLPAIITDLDASRPIYDKSHYYVDLFAAYKTTFWKDRIAATLQFNVRNLGETGRLQPVGAFPDGSISTYRIIDPQEFILSSSFEF